MAGRRPSMLDLERALALLDDRKLQYKGRTWLRFMISHVGCWQAAGDVHMHGHWARVLIHALSLGSHMGLSSDDLDALCVAAIFHDTRRKNPLFDVGHGQRGPTPSTECGLGARPMPPC